MTVPGWKDETYLPMGDDRMGVDHSKPMTGLDIYQDKKGTFHVLGVMERNLKKRDSHYSRPLLQSLTLNGGEPDSRWYDIQDEPINAKGDGLVQFGEVRFITDDEKAYT